MTKTRALITGATGFIGGALAAELDSRGWDTVALVRPESDCSRLNALGARLVPGDLCDPNALQGALEGCEVVFHCGGLTGIGHRRKEYYEANVDGTRNVLRAAVSAGVPKFVHVSSIVVYDIETTGYVCEESREMGQSRDPYTSSKIEAEETCWAAHNNDGISMRIVRPAFVYGPNDRHGGFLPEVSKMISAGKFTLLDGGSNPIPMIFISDLVGLIIACAENDSAHGHAFNGSHSTSPRWSDVANELSSGLGFKPVRSVPSWVVRGAARIFELMERAGVTDKLPLSRTSVRLMTKPYEFPPTKARKQLGFVASTGFERGIRQTVPSIQVLQELLKTDGQESDRGKGRSVQRPRVLE